jgi:hypothetical protein
MQVPTRDISEEKDGEGSKIINKDKIKGEWQGSHLQAALTSAASAVAAWQELAK